MGHYILLKNSLAWQADVVYGLTMNNCSISFYISNAVQGHNPLRAFLFFGD